MYRKSALVTNFAEVDNELSALELDAGAAQDYYRLKKLYAAPSKIWDGMIVYADGTSWNPGSGAGVYVYKVSSWVLLG